MRTRFTRLPFWKAVLGLTLLSASSLNAASFVYEGQLDDRGLPANGRYDIRLAVYRDVELGATLTAPIIFSAVEVVDGRVRLDFELPLEAAEPAWVELAVRDVGAGDFSAIPGRAIATQAPAAIGACWSTVGDSGSNPATHFLGTTDAQPLVLRTRNVQSLRIEPSAELFGGNPITANVIAGSSANTVTAGVRGATIAGGGVPAGDSDPVYTDENPNRVTANYATVAGGYANQAGDNGSPPTQFPFATVGGGARNAASSSSSTVAGGFANAAGNHATAVGGGEDNAASGAWSVIAGGQTNRAMADHSIIGGGQGNTASGNRSTVAGGGFNVAIGALSTISGGGGNCAGGNYSWAGGVNAKIRPAADPGAGSCSGLPSYPALGDAGTFAWADSQGPSFISTGPNQFLIRATGGMAVNGPPIDAGVELSAIADNDGPNYANLFLRQRDFNAGVLFSAGEATSTAANNAVFYIDQFNATEQTRRLTLEGDGDLVVTAAAFKPGGGAWSATSDARLKTSVGTLTGALDRLLALRGTTFEYRADVTPKSMYLPGQQIGFVAQEVELVFPQWVGETADGFKTVGPQGFEALTVEALRELRAESAIIDGEQDARIAALQAENAALRAEQESTAHERLQRKEIDALRGELAELRALIATQRTGGH